MITLAIAIAAAYCAAMCAAYAAAGSLFRRSAGLYLAHRDAEAAQAHRRGKRLMRIADTMTGIRLLDRKGTS